MTLGEGKRKVLMLLDEYSSGGEITVDGDIDAKMNDFFDIAQRDVAAWQPIVRRVGVTLDGTGRMALPEDVSRVIRIRKGGVRAAGYEAIDGMLVYHVGDESALSIDYIAAPAKITPETPDDYAFEVSEDAANCLPYYVAAQQLIADLVVDYGAFYNLYLQTRALLPRSTLLSGGGVRQSLYGR
ncbi:MAG: hypothetical protein IJV43_06425 [Oscillospiraceae bacterium]|nr:hypothetical protein [Oscillospiraceae bacterium]